MSVRQMFLAVALALLADARAPLAQTSSLDYTQWRGVNRDGSASSFSAPSSWPDTLTQRWKVEVGTGYATPLVVGNRIYVFSRQGENEVMTAFYQRVAFANEEFGGKREGWKTDLGRIFIQLGMPDAIEADNVQPRMQRRQIWRYHKLHRHFLFVDQMGFGDFVLVQEQSR